MASLYRNLFLILWGIELFGISLLLIFYFLLFFVGIRNCKFLSNVYRENKLNYLDEDGRYLSLKERINVQKQRVKLTSELVNCGESQIKCLSLFRFLVKFQKLQNIIIRIVIFIFVVLICFSLLVFFISDKSRFSTRKMHNMEAVDSLDDEIIVYENPLVLNEIELEEAKEKVKQGDLYYCNYIAIHYEAIENPDIAQTVYWLTIGAERGEPTCMWNLGYHFYENYHDTELGLYWIKRAAQNGDPDAIDFLENDLP